MVVLVQLLLLLHLDLILVGHGSEEFVSQLVELVGRLSNIHLSLAA